MKDSMVIYRSFYEALKDLPETNRLQVWDAIFELGLNGNTIELSGISKTIFTLIKPQIDANNRKAEIGKAHGQKGAGHGKKGGRPKKDKNPQETPTKPPQGFSENPQETPKEPANVNDNANDNVNDNENVNGNANDAFVATAPKQKKNKEVFFRDSPYFENPELFCADWYATKTATEHPQIDPQILYDSIKLTTDATDKYKYANWIAAAQNWAKRDPKQYYARTGIEQFSRGTQELHRRNETLSQLAYDPITGRPWDE